MTDVYGIRFASFCRLNSTMAVEDLESKLLLQDNEKDEDDRSESNDSLDSAKTLTSYPQRQHSRIKPLLFHGLVFVIYSAIFIFSWSWLRRNQNPVVYCK
jgi:hypothetical protein